MSDSKKILVDRDDLSCPVCLEFKKAKCLSCHHSCCEGCLEKLQVHSKIICPECRTETTVPEGGVKNLPNNFHINHIVDENSARIECGECTSNEPAKAFCQDCKLYLCHVCNEHHKRSKRFLSHNITSFTDLTTNKGSTRICREHNDVLLFYCETCDKLACKHCIVQDHTGHRHNTVESVASEYRKKIKEATAPIEKMIKDLSKAYNGIDKIKNVMQQKGKEVDQSIDECYDGLIQKLTEQKEKLKLQASVSVSEKVKEATTRLEQLKQTQAKVLDTKQQNDALENNTDQKILLEKTQVVCRMEQITNMYEQVMNARPIQNATMKFISNEIPLPQFGWLCSTGEPAPCNCKIADLPTQVFVKDPEKFHISVKDNEGHYCYGERQIVSAQLDDECLQIIDNKNSSYTVRFVAQKVGEMKLSVFVNGMHVAGSPFKVMVYHPYTTFSKSLKIINNYSNLGRSWGITFSRNGKWAITDYSTSFVYIYDSKDELVKMIGSPGMKNDQFECPFGIAFDDNNHLYVVDSGNSRIQKFDLKGNYLFQFGAEKLRNARDITIHNNRVFVADKADRCVAVFDTDGQFCYTIKSQHLRTPCGITVGVNNQLYVADCDNHCIHSFTLDGNYISKFGTKGTGLGQLYKPWGVAADQRGNLLVTDTNNHHVSIFDKDGVCIHCFGTKGQGNGEFNIPVGIALSPSGNIYICDYENKRIQKF